MIAIRDETGRRSYAAALGPAGWLGLAACRCADLRRHGAPDLSVQRRRGHDVLGHGWCVAAEWDGPNVCADERIPFGALAETNFPLPVLANPKCAFSQAGPEPQPPGAGIEVSTRPVFAIVWMRFWAIWTRGSPSNAVPARPATSSERARWRSSSGATGATLSHQG